ncbi:MAG: hypothetical protein R3330_01605 [Saprospiraceae bacterium]|nr:hypothetical protein [Saprospiraceae bacterium]
MRNVYALKYEGKFYTGELRNREPVFGEAHEALEMDAEEVDIELSDPTIKFPKGTEQVVLYTYMGKERW